MSRPVLDESVDAALVAEERLASLRNRRARTYALNEVRKERAARRVGSKR